MKKKTNPNGANQYVLDPRQTLFYENYFDPKSETFSNALQSALRAGYTQEYADNIKHLMPEWLSERMGDMNMVRKAEKNLNKILDMKTEIVEGIENPKLLTIQSDVSQFVAERLGRRKYGKEEVANPVTNNFVQIVINKPNEQNTGNKSDIKTIRSVASSQ